MARLLPLLTSFRGRIGRRSWWLGFILNPDYFLAEELPPPNWPDTLWQALCLWPLTAIVVKRCNDRGWPSGIGPAFAVLNAFYLLAQHFGLPLGPAATGFGAAMYGLLGIFGLAIVIDNGFIPGDDGPNRHGPEPLAPAP